jgi:hypothetical protein
MTARASTNDAATMVRVTDRGSLAADVVGLAIGSRPVLISIGGAARLAPDRTRGFAALFDELARVVTTAGAAVVDGGTEFGVMALFGDARRRAGGTFRLIGVVPAGMAATSVLDPNHDGFVLIPGDDWGDESAWLLPVAHTIAGPSDPIVAVLVDGGDLALQEATACVAAGVPVVVAGGTGRIADSIAGHLIELASSPLVHVVPDWTIPGAVADAVATWLASHLP